MKLKQRHPAQHTILYKQTLLQESLSRALSLIVLLVLCLMAAQCSLWAWQPSITAIKVSGEEKSESSLCPNKLVKGKTKACFRHSNQKSFHINNPVPYRVVYDLLITAPLSHILEVKNNINETNVSFLHHILNSKNISTGKTLHLLLSVMSVNQIARGWFPQLILSTA